MPVRFPAFVFPRLQYLISISSLCAVLFFNSGLAAAQPPAQNAGAPDRSQTKPQGAPQAEGVNTGGTHPAVIDKEHRPITAGGFVKGGPVIFQDIAQKAGLTAW